MLAERWIQAVVVDHVDGLLKPVSPATLADVIEDELADGP